MSQDLFSAPLLQISRPVAFFDIESTGIDYVKDRIIELSVIVVDPAGKENRKTWRFNPGMPIPAEASAVHGIYDEDVITEPSFADKAQEVYELMQPCDLAGFNSNRFDIPLLLEEFLRVGLNFQIDNRNLIDVHAIFAAFEKRNLEAAYQFYCNKTLVNAHSASADVEATYEVLLAQLKRYDSLKKDAASLHEISNQERFIDSGRRMVYLNGRPAFNFGKYKGRFVDEVLQSDPGYYNWMMNADFALHTKQKLTELRNQFKQR